MSIHEAISEARKRRRHAAGSVRRVGIALAGLTAALLGSLYLDMIRMPGESYSGPFAPLSEGERAVEVGLRRDVAALATDIGDRSLRNPKGLAAAADYIERSFTAAGYRVERQAYPAGGGATVANLIAEVPGSKEIVVVGAHYDAVAGTTGADDNASGVAALLALARAFAGKRPGRTLRFVAFANEEPPYFQDATLMGSAVYARRCHARNEVVTAMISLETIGYYTDQAGSQNYPFPFGMFYPKTGDFVAFVGNRASAGLVRRTLGAFRKAAAFPSEGIAAPGGVPGIGWSDQWSFWQEGYQGVMVTDTAPFRNRRYHTTGDTPETLAYGPMARVVVGVERVVEELVSEGG